MAESGWKVSQKAMIQDAMVERQDAFLEAFKRTGTVAAASREVDIPYRSCARWLESDPTFHDRFQEAKDHFADLLEAEAVRRGMEGWEEPVIRQVTEIEGEGDQATAVMKWKEVARIRKFSDRMLELMLKALRPDKFRERVEHSGNIGLSLEQVMLRGHEKARREATGELPEVSGSGEGTSG